MLAVDRGKSTEALCRLAVAGSYEERVLTRKGGRPPWPLSESVARASAPGGGRGPVGGATMLSAEMPSPSTAASRSVPPLCAAQRHGMSLHALRGRSTESWTGNDGEEPRPYRRRLHTPFTPCDAALPLRLRGPPPGRPRRLRRRSVRPGCACSAPTGPHPAGLRLRAPARRRRRRRRSHAASPNLDRC